MNVKSYETSINTLIDGPDFPFGFQSSEWLYICNFLSLNLLCTRNMHRSRNNTNMKFTPFWVFGCLPAGAECAHILHTYLRACVADRDECVVTFCVFHNSSCDLPTSKSGLFDKSTYVFANSNTMSKRSTCVRRHFCGG